ncbi:histidinol dehydrogenase [Elsinoe ampelina]|uniref:Histidinol dehydrogenase n=1 Tax=Elsinoe ampelina TaxID=302913 RepID=A0A6A6G457_9PEZI|nr:histidinol dehydrogenase [Elsinoe ampelina]
MAPKHLKRPITTSTSPALSDPKVATIVSGVISAIRSEGDAAIRKYSEQFDKWSPPSFKLSQADIDKIIATVPAQTIEDIKTVQRNVSVFAHAQRDSIKDFEIETQPGVFLGQRNNPIQSVGCYIPGGRYPLLASAHMTILTAKIAGVPHVTACTPPILGQIPPATVAAMHLAGADEIFILGGVQAVAGMAVGTETMQKVDFIAGPGNAFVAEAKRQLFGEIGIDLFAGPTEILVVADEHADPYTVAVDLLSQAEHGPDTPAVLVTNSEEVATKSIAAVDALLEVLPTAPIAGVSWRDFGEVIVTDTLDEAFSVADEFASEHVEILTRNPRQALEKMKHYGALFLGEGTCVSYGDKCIGTNHVLPTRKAAKYTGGLWVGKYLRTCTYQEVRNPQSSGELGRLCGRAARAENFEGHARSGDVRAANALGDRYEWIESTKGHKTKEVNGRAVNGNGVNGVH